MDRLVRMFAIATMVAVAAPAMSAPGKPDPNLYLEQVDGARALAKVKSWNARTLEELQKQPGFADYRSKGLALLSTNQ